MNKFWKFALAGAAVVGVVVAATTFKCGMSDEDCQKIHDEAMEGLAEAEAAANEAMQQA